MQERLSLTSVDCDVKDPVAEKKQKARWRFWDRATETPLREDRSLVAKCNKGSHQEEGRLLLWTEMLPLPGDVPSCYKKATSWQQWILMLSLVCFFTLCITKRQSLQLQAGHGPFGIEQREGERKRCVFWLPLLCRPKPRYDLLLPHTMGL